MKITHFLFRRNYVLASKLYQPLGGKLKDESKNEMVSKSHQLMFNFGLLESAGGKGLFHTLPVAFRALEKLMKIIDDEMKNVGGQRLILSSLCPKHVMDKTDRFEVMKNDLYKLNDRNESTFCLAPTHEEHVTKLLSDARTFGANRFPLLLYQITNKYRDERNARFGLLRSREFLMKDLYSFDVDEEKTLKTYELVCGAYEKIFCRLNLPVYHVRATSGAMGGDYSHEYHLENVCGQDEILFCRKCSTGMNVQLARESTEWKENENIFKHDQCGQPMDRLRTIEVAHTFILGTKYTKAFDVFYHSTNNEKDKKLLHMACFGIGVSRLLAASIDCLEKNMQIRWPSAISPFKVCVIPPKTGSKEEIVTELAVDIAENLSNLMNFDDGDVLFDDRPKQTVGSKLKDAQQSGYPYIVVVNKLAVSDTVPKFELLDVNNDTKTVVTHAELFDILRQI